MSVALALGAMAMLAAVVQAALPAAGASFAFHDHQTAGKNWHVEFRIDAKDRTKLKTLVVYSQQCKATVAKTGVAISTAGVVAAAGGLKGGGTWQVNATFKDPTTIVGTMRMTRAACDTGVLSYPNAITGDGHTDHSHGGGGHDHGQKYADFASASLNQRRQARALHRRVLDHWRGVTPAKAARLGYLRNPNLTRKLGIFHVYNARYENDRRIFDARRPESLVFWRRPRGRPVILGPMFRVAPGKRPSFAGPIPIYHSHKSKSGGKVKSQMTHVWMVKADRKIAWANCLPVKQLEQYNPAFKWTPGHSNHEHIGAPC